ncbi:MAG TPA: hypothetical protein VLM36_13945 [Sphingomicrobium sp.]|nr:hypothetical protein [Sphingomicrobium sp.]
MTKLLLILIFGAMVANGVASFHSDPPLLIDSRPGPPPPLDAQQ